MSGRGRAGRDGPSPGTPGTRDPREAAGAMAEALRQVFGQHLQAALLKGGSSLRATPGRC